MQPESRQEAPAAEDGSSTAPRDASARPVLGSVALVLLAATFCALCVPFRAFVLDDSFITYRFARHLAEHGSLAWNLGAPPVEGFTSLLWVLVNAAGMLARIDPILTSKFVAFASTTAVFARLWRDEPDAPLGVRLPLIAALACSPALALLSMQGMETATTMLLVTLVAREALLAGDGVDARRGLRLAGLFLLALLARPDTAVFGAGVGVTLVVVHAARRDRASLRGLALCAGAFVAAVALYTGWRLWVFGEPLPNTYYVKMSADDPLRAALGRRYVTDVARGYALPYLVFGLVVVVAMSSRARVLRALPVLAGVAVFTWYVSGINPLQGMGGRFLFPIVPALYLAFLAAADPRRARALAHPAAWVVLTAGAAYWAMRPLEQILFVREAFTQVDRVAAGKALAGLDGKMFVSESGALPYYSGWTTVDRVGLTSDRVAHGGMTRAVLDDFAPDLIQDIGRTGNFSVGPKNRVQVDYMRDHGFVAIAATHRHGRTIHYYFARPDSPLFDECVRRLRGMQGVTHAPLAGQIHAPGIAVLPGEPVGPSGSASQDGRANGAPPR